MGKNLLTIFELQHLAQNAGVEVMFSCMQCLTQNGRYRGPVRANGGLFCPPGAGN